MCCWEVVKDQRELNNSDVLNAQGLYDTNTVEFASSSPISHSVSPVHWYSLPIPHIVPHYHRQQVFMNCIPQCEITNRVFRFMLPAHP